MKNILTLALLLTSLSAFSFEKKASFDFTNVYGNTNAGQYVATVSFIPKTTLSESPLYEGAVRDDNDVYCTRTAQFEIGQLNFTLTDIKTGWSKNIISTIRASIAHKSTSENCDMTLEDFSGDQVLYASVGINDAIILPVKAPQDFTKVGVHLAPFNGYLDLGIQIKIVGKKLVTNPSELLTEKSISALNVNNNSMTYYVFAQKDSTSLSLATGLIPFN